MLMIMLAAIFSVGESQNLSCTLPVPDCFSDDWVYLECTLGTNLPPAQIYLNNIRLRYFPGKNLYRTEDEDTFFHCENELSYTIRSEGCHQSIHGVLHTAQIVRPGGFQLDSVNPAPRGMTVNLQQSSPVQCFSSTCVDCVINVRSEGEEGKELINRVEVNRGKTTLELADLKPFTNYTISIRGRPCGASDEKYLSNWLNFSDSTLSTVPDAPEVSPLGFQLLPLDHKSSLATIYWKKVENKNGDNFTYTVEFDKMSYNTTEAKFTAQVENDVISTFYISSRNLEGSAETDRKIVVPNVGSTADLPKVENSVLLTSYAETRLLWKHHGSEDKVYVFWCHGHPCKDGVDWVEVGADINSISLPDGTSMVFVAIKAFNEKSSGLHQVSCKIHPDDLKSGKFNVSVHLLEGNGAELQLQINLCSVGSADLLIRNSTFHYCEASERGCVGETTSVRGTDKIQLRSLRNSTCYKAWAISSIINGVSVATSVSKFCTPPGSPPDVLSAQLLNTVLSIELDLRGVDDFSLTCRIRSSRTIIESTCSNNLVLQLNKTSFIDKCESIYVSACTTIGCTPWGPSHKITFTPETPVISTLHSNQDGQIHVMYESSQADLCETRLYDNRIREHARLKLNPPNCEDDISSCCHFNRIESSSPLELGTEHPTRCFHFNVTIRCANWVKFKGKIRYLYSEWSNMFELDSPCGSDYGVGELVGIGLGISAATIVAFLIVLAVAIMVYRIKERLSAISNLEPRQGIPLSVSDEAMSYPFPDLPPAYQESSFISESSLPSYTSAQTQHLATRLPYEYSRLPPPP